MGRLVSHRTVAGEDLVQVALKYRLGVDHLAFANGFPVTTLEVEEDTPVFIPSWRILPAHPPQNGLVINLDERLLYLFKNGRFVRYYPISIGDDSAENGRFQTPTGNCVHGTNDSLNIGNSVTHGCMRTHPALGRGSYGALYIANYPDVYKKMPPLEAAQRLLKRVGVKPSRDNFDELLKLQLGVPFKIKGTGSVRWSSCAASPVIRAPGWKMFSIS